MSDPEKVVMSWSGGKDSVLALCELLRSLDVTVFELLTTVAEPYGRVSHHGVRTELLDRQAGALGLKLRKVGIPDPCTNHEYERLMADEMARYRSLGITTIAFGDIFLEDLRSYRERTLDGCGFKAMFPIWGRDTTELLSTFIDLGFKAYITCVDGTKLSREFAGREINASLIDDLPDGIDPCGEYGEFHTFVFDGPIFHESMALSVGEVVERDTRYFAELLSVYEEAAGVEGVT